MSFRYGLKFAIIFAISWTLAASSLAGEPPGAENAWLESQTRSLEKQYAKLGGKITVLVQNGQAHYPLAPNDPKPAVDFISNAVSTAKSLGLAPRSAAAFSVDFRFDRILSREVLENYLLRSITVEVWLTAVATSRTISGC